MKYNLYRGYLHTVPEYFGVVKVFTSKANALADNPIYTGMAEINALEWLDEQSEGFVGSEDLDELNRMETVVPKYNNSIMERVRQHLGLEEYDTSRDGEINRMSHDAVLDHVLEWEGIIGYGYQIRGWVENIYGVKLETFGT